MNTSSSEFWLDQIKLCEKDAQSWHEESKNIIRRYRDAAEPSRRRRYVFNVLWSNVQTQLPNLYSRTPAPQVDRRNRDPDPTGRIAALMLERALMVSLDDYDFDSTMRAVVLDRLLVGRGTARVRYKATLSEEIKTYESVSCEYVHWADFSHGPARTWHEVPWVGFRNYLTPDEAKARFGSRTAKQLNFDHVPANAEQIVNTSATSNVGYDADAAYKKAIVYEIWDKASEQVVWVSPSLPDKILDQMEDPLRLHGFFPCPKPLYSTLTTDSLIPVPDYHEYRDQAEQLDILTERIGRLSSAIRIRGLYNGANPTIRQLMNAPDETMIGVEQWAMHGDKGGLANQVEYFPINEVVQTVTALIQAREVVKRDLYEVTGLSDILRGSSRASETLGAQKIKSQFASIRLADSQADVARFARDLLRLKGEIMAEHFDFATLAEMSGAVNLSPEDQMMALQAHALLQDDRLRSFRVDIETDSTVLADQEADKQSRIEFLTSMTQLLQVAVPAVQQQPALGPLMAEFVLFGVRGFRTARTIESSFEQALADLQQQAQQAPPGDQQGDPAAMAKLQLDQAKLQSDQQHQQARLQLESQIEGQKLQLQQQRTAEELALKKYEIDTKAELERLKMHAESQLKAQKQEDDRSLKEMDQIVKTMTQIMQRMAAKKKLVTDDRGEPVGVEVLSDPAAPTDLDQLSNLILNGRQQLVLDELGNPVGSEIVLQ